MNMITPNRIVSNLSKPNRANNSVATVCPSARPFIPSILKATNALVEPKLDAKTRGHNNEQLDQAT